MIRVTVDTNTLVSGVTTSTQSVNNQIIQTWRENKYTLILSEYILNEIQSTLLKPYFSSRLTTDQIIGTVMLFRQEAIITPINVNISGVASQAKDDPILATAISGKVDYLVTRDDAFRQKVPEYQGVKLISPPQFLEILKK